MTCVQKLADSFEKHGMVKKKKNPKCSFKFNSKDLEIYAELLHFEIYNLKVRPALTVSFDFTLI